MVANNLPVKTGEGAVRAIRRPCRRSSTTPPPASAASRTSISRCSRTAPVWTPCTCPTRAAARRSSDVVAGHVPMTITSVQATKGLVETGKVKGAGSDQPDAFAGHAGRADHAGGRRAARRRRTALLVRDLRPEGHAAGGQGQARPGGRQGDEDRPARAPRQARHHAGRHPGRGAAQQAAKRDQELDAGSSTPRASRRNTQGEVPHIPAPAAYRRQSPLVVE